MPPSGMIYHVVPFLQLFFTMNDYTMCHLPGDMILINTFEEPFADIYPNGVWSIFKGDYSTMDQNVVSLASFKGDYSNLPFTISYLLLVAYLIDKFMASRKYTVVCLHGVFYKLR